MADRQWFNEGVQVHEEGEEEYFVEGLQLCEDQPAPAAGSLLLRLQTDGLYVGMPT